MKNECKVHEANVIPRIPNKWPREHTQMFVSGDNYYEAVYRSGKV